MVKLDGIIKNVFETKTFSGNFEKRIFWLQSISTEYPNTWQLELWKKDCAMIDSYKEGEYITAYIDIKGAHWKKPDGSEFIMNSLKCWNIEKEVKLFKPI
jgi:hypothetical protein